MAICLQEILYICFHTKHRLALAFIKTMNIYIRRKKTYNINLSESETKLRLKALTTKEPDDDIVNVLSIAFFGLDRMPKYSGYIGKNTFSISPEFKHMSSTGYHGPTVFYSIEGEIEEIHNGTKIKITIEITEILQKTTKILLVISGIMIAIAFLAKQPLDSVVFLLLLPIGLYLFLTIRLIIGFKSSISILDKLFLSKNEL